MNFDRLSKPIWRLPYYWEDDFAACDDPTWHWTNPAPPSDGLRIFDPVVACGNGVLRLTEVEVEGTTDGRVRILKSLRQRLG